LSCTYTDIEALLEEVYDSFREVEFNRDVREFLEEFSNSLRKCRVGKVWQE
jgi:hypothetical protein